MFLLTTTGFVFEKENWIQFIKEKNIKKVILVRLVKKHGPFNWSREQSIILAELKKIKEYEEWEKQNLRKAIETISSTLDLFEQLYMEYEYYELLEDETELKKTAYLAKIVVQQNLSGIIDIARGERILIASFFKLAQYFPEKIVELGLSDFSINKFIPIIIPFLEPDPDQRQKTTYKEILNCFLPPKNSEYVDIPSLVKYSSAEVEEKVPSLAASHLKSRLSNMTRKAPGKPKLLESIEDPEDKRKFVYTITEYGLFTIYITYQRKKLDKIDTKDESWISDTELFEKINFVNCNQVKQFNPFSK